MRSFSGDAQIDELAASMYRRLSDGRSIVVDCSVPDRAEDVSDVVKEARGLIMERRAKAITAPSPQASE